MTGVRAWLSTPQPVGGAAIGAIDLGAPDGDAMDAALRSLGLAALAPGEARLVDLLDVDRGLCARWSDRSAQLMPHAGALVLERLIAGLAERGFGLRPPDDPRELHPEARDLVEACAMDAIARAASPLAIDAILHHAALWRTRGPGEPSRELDRLIRPPTVVLIGPPNIGKSSLTNALARRSVSIVADEPGTTRDHVGVSLELDGLTVRWIDGAGLAAAPRDDVDRRAIESTQRIARAADLVVSCRDGRSGFVPAPAGVPELRIGLRSDLGESGGVEAQTSALRGEGIADLARRVRERLVPGGALESSTPWRFHGALPDTPG